MKHFPIDIDVSMKFCRLQKVVAEIVKLEDEKYKLRLI